MIPYLSHIYDLLVLLSIFYYTLRQSLRNDLSNLNFALLKLTIASADVILYKVLYYTFNTSAYLLNINSNFN
jgi:hypothetical protein